jgi:predicted Zn-dependent protease
VGKWLILVLSASALLGGCVSVPRGSIPVVDAGSSAYEQGGAAAAYGAAAQPKRQEQATAEDSGVVVMVPGAGGSGAIESYPVTASAASGSTNANGLSFDEPPLSSEPLSAGGWNGTVPAPASSSGVALGGSTPTLAADEQLDGPVLALLTSAQQQQGSGDLNGASSSLERAQRIAPREPQVLYRLAEVRLAQGDAAQAEQFARRGLSYANGRPALQASLWGLIAQARERQGDAAGAAQARAQARVKS